MVRAMSEDAAEFKAHCADLWAAWVDCCERLFRRLRLVK